MEIIFDTLAPLVTHQVIVVWNVFFVSLVAGIGIYLKFEPD
ncbi:MAG: hypothetical protein WCW14_00465 [Candidatus Paceibacterota bacterium]